MREVLFRGKRTDNGEWVYGGIVHQIDYYGDKVDEWIIIDGETIQDYDIGYGYKVNPSTIGQFAGLTDKNGNKIFEGDVIRLWGGECFSGFWEHDAKTVVKDITDGVCVIIGESENVEIIGNIHDNSNLLKIINHTFFLQCKCL